MNVIKTYNLTKYDETEGKSMLKGIPSILSPDLSEEDFNYAKSELIYRRKHDKSQASLQTTNTYQSLEELKKR